MTDEVKPFHTPYETLAQQVINGQWGEGDERSRQLRHMGYDPVKVQQEVDRLSAP